MAKYKVLFNDELEDEVFDTEEEAEEHALYLVSCTKLGAEIIVAQLSRQKSEIFIMN